MRKLMLEIAAVVCSLFAVAAIAASSDIGVVVMHGKGGSPQRWVNELADALAKEGFQVANLEMPWSRKRGYDVGIKGGVDEISQALDAMRAKGAHKVFVAGHSQGGLFALYYAGLNHVDGVIAVAPGGQVDSGTISTAVSSYVAQAKDMIKEGRGDEKASFIDAEGSRAPNPITTTASIYFEWFDPYGALTSRVFRKVIGGTPVLYIGPLRDYPGLAQSKGENYGWLPSHPKKRMYEPNTDHMHAPGDSAIEIIHWINDVAGG